MAKIALMEDVGVPAVVAGVNIAVHHVDAGRLEKNPNATLYEPIVGVLGIAVGYGMQAFDKSPVVGNRIAVASMVPGIRGIYDWARSAIKAPVSSSAGMVARRKAGARISGAGNPGETQDPLARYKESGL